MTTPALVRRVHRVVGFDLRGMVSLWLLVARRRHGVPAGAAAVSYSRAQTPLMLVFLGVMVAELVAVDLLLRALGAPDVLRRAFLFVDGYSILIVLAVVAAGVTRPHVVSAAEVRIRYGAFFDLRIPRERVAAVRRVRNHDESRIFTFADGEAAIAVSSQTNVELELDPPVTAVRPLGGTAEIRKLRFFADDPEAAMTLLKQSPASATARRR
jgi:hypothetical protein